MTTDRTASTAPAASAASVKRAPITIERTLRASPEDVWEMWTTREGLESWWGPERFASTVRALDLRPGGRLEIAMTTTDPEVAAWLEANGQPTTSIEKITFAEIVPMTRLAFLDRFDHAPGVEPYDVSCAVTFEPVPDGTRMRLTSDAMHDERWTQLATDGWSSSLDKLAAALER
jgi:uncharacterized protein YndB with AHSA1/START domain